MLNQQTLLCKFCEKDSAKYKCPKCQSDYCSLECYKSRRHQKCSEEFYKDCVSNEATFPIYKNDKKKIIQLLKKFHGEKYNFTDELDGNKSNKSSDSGIYSSETLDAPPMTDPKFDLDALEQIPGDQLWNLLSEPLKKDFENQLKTGQVFSFLKRWTPWWKTNSESVFLIENNYFQVPKNIKALQSNSRVSPYLWNNLIEVIYCYVATLYVFNGDYKSFYAQYLQSLISLSFVCKPQSSFFYSTPIDAIQSIVYSSRTHPDYSFDSNFCARILGDLLVLFQSLNYLINCLAELYDIIKNCIKYNKTSSAASQSQSEQQQQLPYLQHKVKFYISWLLYENNTMSLRIPALLKEIRREIEHQIKLLKPESPQSLEFEKLKL